MFYPTSKAAKLRFANALMKLRESEEGTVFIDAVRDERAKLHSQMEVAPPDLFQIMQGKAQSFTDIIDVFGEASSLREKLRQKK